MSAPHISARGVPGSNQMPAPFYPSRSANLMNQRPTLEAVSIVQHNSTVPHTVPEYTVVVNSQFPPGHSTSVGQNNPFNPNNPMQARPDNIYQPQSFVPTGAPFIYPMNPYFSQPATQWLGTTSAAPLGGQYIQTMPYSQLLPPNAIRVSTSNMAAGGTAPVSASQAAAVKPESNAAHSAVSPAMTDQPPFGKPPGIYSHEQHVFSRPKHPRQTTTPPTQGAAQAGGRVIKDTTSGNDRPKPSHSPAIATQSQENVAQMENAYSELSLAIAQVTDKKDDQKVAAAHPKPLPHAENPPAAAAAVKRVEEAPPPQQVAPAAAAPPITFGFFDDSGVGAGSDEISSPSPPEASPEKTTQPEAAVPAGSGAEAVVAVELTNTTVITSSNRSAIVHTTEEISSTTAVATVVALEKKDAASLDKREIANVEKVPVKDPQAELLGELKNKKATNAWFYDNPEGNRVYDSEYMFLLLKLPLSCQKPEFTTHLSDVCMSDWENRAEQSV
uniref:Uncharacterized protein n=1 Tax=Romanomermis culicivorax TaxID=13658 RepID=A0A915JZF5_ROMCU